MIHHARQISGAESIIDIHNADTAGAGIQHGEQGGHTAEGRAVSDAGGHRDHRAVGETADDAGESAFHPRDGDNYTGIHICFVKSMISGI